MEREWFIHNTTLFGNRDDIYNPKIGLVDADNFVVAYPERDSITRFLYGGFGVIRIIGMNRHQAGPTWEYYPKYADFRTYRFGGMRYDPVAGPHAPLRDRDLPRRRGAGLRSELPVPPGARSVYRGEEVGAAHRPAPRPRRIWVRG